VAAPGLSPTGDGITDPGSQPLAAPLQALLAARGVRGALHVHALDGDREVALHPDAPVVLASTFKVAVAVELFRQAAVESLDLTTRIVAPAAGRAFGPGGVSAMADDVELSLRDAAYSMMALGDNAATDALIAHIGLDRIQATLTALGLHRTVLVGNCAYLWDTIAADLGFTSAEELHAALRGAVTERAWRRLTQRLRKARALRPPETSRSTPCDMTRLLRAVWRERALPPEACARVRAAMGHERSVAARRLGPAVHASVKGGTLAGIVFNEVGVVDLGDGEAYAFAFFTRVSRRTRAAGASAAADAMARALQLALEHLSTDPSGSR
jgi:beta-lactamase class A